MTLFEQRIVPDKRRNERIVSFVFSLSLLKGSCASRSEFFFLSFPVVRSLVATFYFILALPFFIFMFVSVKVRMDDNSVETLAACFT